ncbi:hypothetical protein Vretimale_11208 [Volvox reticuliferus]|uniref:Uncharacterized protein n=1 Tax=Volvox reticuliferus TaxID=1737510 RepID=A0A8J4LS51_9CHLO|nr:hypothetical protein Vretifemale_12253 [Volvox reticuliferus]GIM06988.1 hypothetical protein Vretimale_11208 [Volvox reticuliferus]
MFSRRIQDRKPMVGCPQVDAVFVAPAGTRGGATSADLAAAPMGGLVAVVVCVTLVGACDGLCQGALFAEAAQLPPPFTQAVVTGTASSGLLVCLLRIASKASFESGADSAAGRAAGLRNGTRLYFALAGLMSLSCLILYDTLLPRLRTLTMRGPGCVPKEPTPSDHDEDTVNVCERYPLLLPQPLELSKECRSQAGSAEGSSSGGGSRLIGEAVDTASANGGPYLGTAESPDAGTRCVVGVGDAAAALPASSFVTAAHGGLDGGAGGVGSVVRVGDGDGGDGGGGSGGGGGSAVFCYGPLVQATAATVAATDAGRGGGGRPPAGEGAPFCAAQYDTGGAAAVSGSDGETRTAPTPGTHGGGSAGGVWQQIQRCLALSWALCGSLFVTYTVTLSIFPGFLSEDIHSARLGDWYPILLITAFNLADLIGKSLPVMSPLAPHPPLDEDPDASPPPVPCSKRYGGLVEGTLPDLERQQQGRAFTDHPNHDPEEHEQDHDSDHRSHQLDHPRLQQMPLLSSQSRKRGGAVDGGGTNRCSSSSSGGSERGAKRGSGCGRSFGSGVLRAASSSLAAAALRPLRQPEGLLLASLLRGLVALPAFLVAARFEAPAWVMGALTAAFGISNGYLTTQVMTMGPAAVLSPPRVSTSPRPSSAPSSSAPMMTTTTTTREKTGAVAPAAAAAACQSATSSGYLSGARQDITSCHEGPSKVEQRPPTSSSYGAAGTINRPFTIAAATGYQPLPAAESVEGDWGRDTGAGTKPAAEPICAPSVGTRSVRHSAIAVRSDPNQSRIQIQIQVQGLGQGPGWVNPGAPEPPSHHHDAEVVETLLVISLVAGLNVGAYLGWLWLL